MVEKNDRMGNLPDRGDNRERARRDRDRILHSMEFQRLGGVTQVASPAEAPISHSRLTHTLKVAQIARGIADLLNHDQRDEARALGGVNADIAEAAALAHDLGHPPFGHIAEQALDDLLEAETASGFEGNCQSFRIVTKLSIRRKSSQGLDLTAGTLNGILKYPVNRSGANSRKKAGAYESERQEFQWARSLTPGHERSAEAEIMDWADDIAYSVHDLEDFYKAGLIPLERLVNVPEERRRFLAAMFDRWRTIGREFTPSESEALEIVGEELLACLDVTEEYWGTRDQRGRVRAMTSYLIDRYIRAIRLNVPEQADDKRVWIAPQQKMEVTILKELTWVYVIENPTLSRLQYGKRRIIESLFHAFLDARPSERSILPVRCQEELLGVDHNDTSTRMRIIADALCALTDSEAIRIYRSLVGTESMLILDNSNH